MFPDVPVIGSTVSVTVTVRSPVVFSVTEVVKTPLSPPNPVVKV